MNRRELMRSFFLFALTILTTVLVYYGIGGKSFMNFIDVSCVLIVIIFPFLFTCIANGFSGLKTAFTIKTSKGITKENLLKAHSTIKMYGNTTWLSSLIVIVLAGISFLASYSENTEFYMIISAVAAFISVLYAAIVNILLLPLKTTIKERMYSFACSTNP